MRKYYILFVFCLCWGFALAQKGNKEVYFGNKAYQKGDLKTAVQKYQQALEVAPHNETARINLAIAQSKLAEADKSVKNFDEALAKNKSNPALSSKLNYDKGVTLAKDKKYQEAVNSFEKTLRNSPDDADARDNLQKAINELKKQQQKNKPDKKDDNKKQPPPPPKKDNQQKKPDKQNQQQQGQMSKDQAEKLLKALREQEKETQKKLQQRPSGTPPPNGKDW